MQIDRLSDIVDQLLMSKTYQLLSDEIQSQVGKVIILFNKLYHTKTYL